MDLLIFIMALLVLAFTIVRYEPAFNRIAIAVAVFLTVFSLMGGFNWFFALLVWSLFIGLGLLLGVPAIRLRLLTRPLLKQMKMELPPMSETEREAIEAGSVWWESELFRGAPNWQQLHDYPKPQLSEEEQAFLAGPVDRLCAMLDDWDITHQRMDLPESVWSYLKEQRFFGMIIPKEYGGLALSALAHSEVVMKIGARSLSAGVTVMVPNSLGPAQLLLEYGTQAQRDHYLPRLADGRDIPCFALTGPSAGSDAGSIPDTGVVCREQFNGEETLGLRLNWEKRYITLGPVATVLGLAFKVYDPDQLLGGETDLGITCALIPANSKGVRIGSRHLPMNSAFQNGPNRGQDVFIPMDYVIGGEKNIGKGWRMLVESLSEGRGISLPAMGTAAGKMATRVTGAYARIRHQFNTPIGKFEGVEEVLARIGGMTYLMDAGRLLTLSALDQGERPAVVTAILKYHNTEKMRQVLNDAMDIHGGRGICMGPSNYLARAYQTIPIGITVEGANILTRSMIIFGQGAIRCHPYLVAEMESAGMIDPAAGEKSLDRALIGHIRYFVTNLCRSFVYSLSASHLAPSPVSGQTASYYRRMGQMSAVFATLSDLTLMTLGGSFKRKEMLSGRFSDALSYLYYASAILKKFEDDGQPQADSVLVEWATKYCLYQTQAALDEALRNFPYQWLGVLVRVLVFPLGLSLRQPNHNLSQQVATLLTEPGEARDRLTKGIYHTTDASDITGCLEDALEKSMQAEPILRRLRKLDQSRSDLQTYAQWIERLRVENQLSAEEAEILTAAQQATERVIQVDEFDPEQLSGASKKAAKKTRTRAK